MSICVKSHVRPKGHHNNVVMVFHQRGKGCSNPTQLPFQRKESNTGRKMDLQNSVEMVYRSVCVVQEEKWHKR